MTFHAVAGDRRRVPEPAQPGAQRQRSPFTQRGSSAQELARVMGNRAFAVATREQRGSVDSRLDRGVALLQRANGRPTKRQRTTGPGHAAHGPGLVVPVHAPLPPAAVLAPPPAAVQAPPPPPPCVLTTRTLVSAPDGTADNRTTVGVNEEVEITASTNVATWAAAYGTAIVPVNATSAIWTAPNGRGAITVTATPLPAVAAPATVQMHVVRPARRTLRNAVPRVYGAGLAGSGFVADVVISPLDVSFSRIEVQEGQVAGVATGVYFTAGWHGALHPLGHWLPVNAANGGIADTIGTVPPGWNPPFAAGRFDWPIPQRYRRTGTGGQGYLFGNVAHHRQIMQLRRHRAHG